MRLWPFGRKAEKRSVTYQDVWGSGGDVEAIKGDSINTALSLIPVFAATRLIADSVSSLPLETYQTSKGISRKVSDPKLLQSPTQYGTVVDWIHRAVTSLALRGNAYGLILERDNAGNPTRIEWIHPDLVSIEQDDTRYVPVWYCNGKKITNNEDFLHIPGYTLPGKVLGLSPISASKLTIETALMAQGFGKDWFDNGSTPAAVLETTEEVDQDQANEIKRRFKRSAKGREPVVLGLGVNYKPISVPAEESQFLATIRASKTDIATIYGVPPELIGGETGQSMTYSTTEQQQIQLVTYALRPYLVKIEKALSRLFPKRFFFKFNVDEILRADMKTRFESYSLALSAGWVNKDEVRAREDMAPIPDGSGADFDQPTPPQPAVIPAGGTPNDAGD